MSEENRPDSVEGAGDGANGAAVPTDQAPALTGSMPRVSIEHAPVSEHGPAASGDASTGGAAEGGSARDAAGSSPHAARPAQPVADAPRPQAVVEERRTVVKTKTKKMPVFFAAFGGFVLGAVLLVALVMTGALDVRDNTVQVVEQTGGTTTIDIDPEDATLAEAVAAKALPSVASIYTQTIEGQGIGSGVVLDTDGHILTNYHVVENASDIVVKLGDESYEAELLGEDASSDLAVVKVDAPADALAPIEVADSDELQVGEWVMAIGSPFGNEQSVSTGIVSSLYRSTALPSSSGTSIYANMIQTDAAINPGNSGGALVNDEGKLIGINSVIESYSGSSSGVGFAIPSNYAIDIANQIIDGKTPVHPYLGVTLTSVDARSARENDLAVSAGAYVVSVAEGGPAEAAGIREGDVVTQIDGEDVTTADSLIISIREHAIGDKVSLTVVSGSDERTVEVTLGSDEALQEEQQDAATGGGSGNSMSDEEFRRYLEELLGSQGYGN